MLVSDDSGQIISYFLGGGGGIDNKYLATKTQRCPSSKVKCLEAVGEEISKRNIMFITIFISLSCCNNNGRLLLISDLIPGTELGDSYNVYVCMCLI